MTIGERIKQKRLELNMSQDELAKKVGYKSRSSIQKIEAARDLPLRKVSKMADALETTPGHLMGWDVEDNEEVSVVAPIVPIEPMDREKAIELFEMYSQADPEIQKAVDLLLKSSQQSPLSVD